MYTSDFSEYRAKKISEIKTRMNSLGLTAEQVAEKAGLEFDLVKDIVDGSIRFIDDDVYDALAGVLHWEKYSTYFKKKLK